MTRRLRLEWFIFGLWCCLCTIHRVESYFPYRDGTDEEPQIHPSFTLAAPGRSTLYSTTRIAEEALSSSSSNVFAVSSSASSASSAWISRGVLASVVDIQTTVQDHDVVTQQPFPLAQNAEVKETEDEQAEVNNDSSQQQQPPPLLQRPSPPLAPSQLEQQQQLQLRVLQSKETLIEGKTNIFERMKMGSTSKRSGKGNGKGFMMRMMMNSPNNPNDVRPGKGKGIGRGCWIIIESGSSKGKKGGSKGKKGSKSKSNADRYWWWSRKGNHKVWDPECRPGCYDPASSKSKSKKGGGKGGKSKKGGGKGGKGKGGKGKDSSKSFECPPHKPTPLVMRPTPAPAPMMFPTVPTRPNAPTPGFMTVAPTPNRGTMSPNGTPAPVRTTAAPTQDSGTTTPVTRSPSTTRAPTRVPVTGTPVTVAPAPVFRGPTTVTPVGTAAPSNMARMTMMNKL